MPIHDWTRVDAGIFHHFHQQWIVSITNILNQRLLPGEYYALAEQHGVSFEPDVLTLKVSGLAELDDDAAQRATGSHPTDRGKHETAGGGVLVAEPRVRVKAETDLEFYRRKQNVASVRHVSDDHLVAIVEIASKGNKSGRKAFDDFICESAEFISHRVHLLVLDLYPATARDPHGIHGAIWDAVAGEAYSRPNDKPLTLASYESGGRIRAFVEPVSVGDALSDMPLFLEPGQYVELPLEETYRVAFDAVPRRWRAILEPR
jgi:hypothetical protein